MIVEQNVLIWLGPTLAAMFSWGIAQGLVKKYVGEVPPARFCLYYALANAVVSTLFWFVSDTPDVLAPAHRDFLHWGLAAYLLDGIAWIFYYQSIVHGPISIVGTLSAAYPALTVVLARLLLDEKLSTPQYAGVVAVLAGCLALAWSPDPPPPAQTSAPGDGAPQQPRTPTSKRWMLFAGAAVVIWGVNGVVVKKAYTFEGASEGNMALFIAVGGLLTLGVYGFFYGRQSATTNTSERRREWARAFLPMALMACGGLLAAIAYKHGPASIVTPLSGAYPVITLIFAMVVLKERPTKLHWAGIVAILLGMLLTTLQAPAEQAPADKKAADAGSVAPQPSG